MQRLGFSEVWYDKGSENEGLTWANNLHTAVVDGNVSAYLYWIGAGGYGGDVPLVWLHDGSNNYTISATYWATAHCSRFVRPGVVRVGVDADGGGDNHSVRTSAFRNVDGSYVVQAIINGDSNVTVVLHAPPSRPRQFRSITNNVTDKEPKLQELDGNDPSLDVTLLPRSLTTFHVQYRRRRDRT
ncbi:hypothetical protein SBRCBS47491_000698 [Sporothrix bragantina]|uniref:Glycosyl hydrolase family 30 beta sandwich domain-containing protein n=1 Tax=Sporothrix bragantina TaxID=671064 RepID=A0ABP0ASI7_9PEZI